MNDNLDLLTRRVEQILPSKEGLEKIISKKKIRVYQGFDPSKPDLHIGHLVGLLQLKAFQDAGHEVIFLIGDYTGMIGDPTDKGATRPKLTHGEVLKNAETYKEQAGKILRFQGENAAKIKFNSEWLSKLNFGDVLELASNFTVQQMLERDMFRQRMSSGNMYTRRNKITGDVTTFIVCTKCNEPFIAPIKFNSEAEFTNTVIKNNFIQCKNKKCNEMTGFGNSEPIYLHEFLYPLMQGYDSVAMEVDLEIGGNDQLFNMMAGRRLMQKLKNKEKYVLTTKLLADSQGKKIGKTANNATNLFGNPNNLFGGIMSIKDEMIVPLFWLATEIPLEMVQEMENSLNTMDFKKKLSWEITKMCNSEDVANQAQAYFESTVQNKELPKDITKVTFASSTPTASAVLAHDIFPEYSMSEIKRLHKQGGYFINNNKVTDPNEIITPKNGDVHKAGKRNHKEVEIK